MNRLKISRKTTTMLVREFCKEKKIAYEPFLDLYFEFWEFAAKKWLECHTIEIPGIGITKISPHKDSQGIIRFRPKFNFIRGAQDAAAAAVAANPKRKKEIFKLREIRQKAAMSKRNNPDGSHEEN